ncbi:MAG: hypothetical protein WD059_13070 [Balneolaceae bacterium]
MKEKIGLLLTITGLVGVMFYGYQYYQQSSSFEVFGTGIFISTGDYTPIIIAAIVMVSGILLSRLNIR